METAALLIIGDEILTGEVVDENGPFVLRVLNEAGVRVVRVVVAPDQREVITTELRRLRAVADAVVISGGIGPTHDDVTRPAVAETLGLDLEVQPEAEARVQGFYADRATDAEMGMALMPRGATLLDGRDTKTFGFQVAGVFSLPGVPFLFRDVARELPGSFERCPLHRRVLETHRREGEIAGVLAAEQARCVDVAIGSYPIYEDGRWRVRVVLRGADERRLREVAEALDPEL